MNKNLYKILVVEDDEHIGDLIEVVLKKEGYDVSRAYSGSEALLILDKIKPSLILLDLMLPGVTGEEVLKSIVGIPVIVVSAKMSIDDKVNLLSIGANDYITKPFDIKELIARVEVQLRKKPIQIDQNILSFQNIHLDCKSKTVNFKDEEIHLTKTEFSILEILLRNCNIVVTKTNLLSLLSFEDIEIYDSSLKVHMCNLRNKLKEKSNVDYIESVWGVGFKMKKQ